MLKLLCCKVFVGHFLAHSQLMFQILLFFVWHQLLHVHQTQGITAFSFFSHCSFLHHPLHTQRETSFIQRRITYSSITAYSLSTIHFCSLITGYGGCQSSSSLHHKMKSCDLLLSCHVAFSWGDTDLQSGIRANVEQAERKLENYFFMISCSARL